MTLTGVCRLATLQGRGEVELLDGKTKKKTQQTKQHGFDPGSSYLCFYF